MEEGRRGVALRGALFAVAVAIAAVASGCSRGLSHFGSGGEHPSSVVIDFHAGRILTAACSGTLLSSDVVLTSAHCVDGSDGAVVRAPDAGGRVATAATAFVYGWDPHEDPTRQRDIALLILRAPIRLARYAVVQRQSCDGCGVVELHRTRTGGEVLHDVVESEHLKLARKASRAHPLAMIAPVGTGDSGGAVLRTDSRGSGMVVGVTIGDGRSTGDGYIARLDDPDVQRWIQDITYLAWHDRQQGTKGQRAGGVLRLLDDPCVDDGTGNCDGSDDDAGDDPSSDPWSDPVQSDTSDDPGGDDAGGDDAAGDDLGGDDASGDDAGADYADDAGGGEDASAGDDGGDDSGSGDDGGSGDDASDDAGTSDEPVDMGGAPGDGGDAATPDGVDEGGAGDDGGPGDGAYDEALSIKVGALHPLEVKSTATSWTAFPKWDARLQESAQRFADGRANANVISTHGNPGAMEGFPDKATLQSMATNGQPIILDSCYGAANNRRGGSNAHDLADEAGVASTDVYACPQEVTNSGGTAQCDGDWVDAAGHPLTDAQRSSHGLENCSAYDDFPLGQMKKCH